ncbi:Atrophin-1 domain containing protein [Pyrenophora tritici-repentis]|uniref:Atrophin-1 domain containing protein n=1 Tax=Pyrenophora tritici-repentis TaxID=45151 RepID=A0A834RSY8_9PLEO|nr:Atrophin-1 domain containing protein [Pyrenophora tritici-repentis]
MDFPHTQLQASIVARVYLTTGVPSIYGQPNMREGSSDGEGSIRQHSLKSSSSLRNLGSLFGRSRTSVAGSSTQLASIAGADHEDDDTSATTERYHEPVIFEDETESSHESIGEGEIGEQITFQDALRYQDDDRHNHQGLFERRHQATVGRQGQDQVQCPQVSIPDDSITFGRSTRLKVKPTTTIDGASMYGADFDVAAALRSLEAHMAKETSEETNPEEVSDNLYQHSRPASLHVTLSSNDLERLTKELYEQTIADVHLSLFAFWINTSPENYHVARKHVRELGCDKGYIPCRLTNLAVRHLLTETEVSRPEYVHPKHCHYHNAALTTTSSHHTANLSGLKIWILIVTETDQEESGGVALRVDGDDGVVVVDAEQVSTGYTNVDSINANMAGLGLNDAASEAESDEDDEFRSRLASIYERMVVVQGPEELDEIMEELKILRALWAPRRV